MASAAVVAEDLGKTYRVFDTPWDRLLEAVSRRPRHRRFEALAGVGFELPRGEGLGVIGQNGAGKSTLLKILAGIVAPTAGRMEVCGQVASILELGSGFHPEFTGRQNIRLNAAMLGLGPREVEEKTPAIIEFSELGEFIDRPVKTYSTGMAMRLGFSIATQVEPDVLIIDEALSVGDGYFQKKCMDQMQRFLADGGTLLFCSHALYYVASFCRRALWLRHGRTAALGPTEEVVREYESFLVAKSRRAQAEEERAAAGVEPAPEEVEGARPARITSVRLEGGEPSRGDAGPLRFEPGDSLALEVEWEVAEPGLACHLGVGVNRADEIEVLSFGTHRDGVAPLAAAEAGGRRALRLEVPALPMLKGRYTLYVFLLDEDGLLPYDRRIVPEAFEIVSPSYVFGLVRADHRWTDPDGAVSGVARPLAAVEQSRERT